MKLGIIGLGAIGSMHLKNISEGKVPGCEIGALCDEKVADPSKFAAYKLYTKLDDLLADKSIDAVLVATPSFNHYELAKKCLEAGKHTLIEKPIALSSLDAKRIAEVAAISGKVCGIMLNQRTTPLYSRIKELVATGALGKINRVSWFMTNWYRPQIYFSSSPWRGTWKGEAGGALINQSIHNIDIFAWIFGMPKTLRAWCKFGKYHDIEVEDEATAYFEYENGMTGTFATATGEHPGTNRLEIAGDKGFVVAQDGKLKMHSFSSLSDYTMQTKYVFGSPDTVVTEESFDNNGEQHAGVLKGFIAAVRNGGDFAFDCAQGYNSVCLANAMLLSSWTNADVSFPFDDAKYADILEEKIAASHFRQKVDTDFILEFTKSFR